jgi:hypothetical protein
MSSPSDNEIRHPPPQSAPGVSPGAWLSESQNRMARKSITDEQRPLLYKPVSREDASQKIGDVEMVRDGIEDYKAKVYQAEFVKILKMSGPVIFAYMLQNSLQTGSVLVVGRMVSFSIWFNIDYRGQMNWLLLHLVTWLR